MDLAENLLTYDPTKRISATDALKSDYFLIEDPPMEIPAQSVPISFPSCPPRSSADIRWFLPSSLAEVGGEFHELEAKREKGASRFLSLSPSSLPSLSPLSLINPFPLSSPAKKRAKTRATEGDDRSKPKA